MIPRQTLAVVLRLLITGLAAAIAGIHLDLWSSHGYRHIPTIGALFLLNAIGGFLLAAASLGLPSRLVRFAWLAVAGYAAVTLIALIISVNAELFGFTESTNAPLIVPSVAVEAAAILVVSSAAAWSRLRRPTET